MSDLELDFDSDHEVSEKHSELIEAVRQLNKGQRIKKLEQYEHSLEISEYSTLKSATENLDQDALGISKKKIKAKLKLAPLERPDAERIKRTVGFENTKKELGKWTGIIARNRTAACVSFPLSQTSMKLEGTNEYVKRFRLQSELQKKMAEVEKNDDIERTEDEFPLTLQEILEQRREAAKFRAQQSYKAAKATRQNKIKSKKYHRIQRKEKIKKALKEFEELQKTDPQAALEKLEQLDRARAEERMSLRHKSTGQWARNKQVRAKYDKESRLVLAAQLSINKELTRKVKKDEDSEDDDDENNMLLQQTNDDNENPWMKPVKCQSEIDDFISGYRKYWDKQNQSQNKSNQNEIQLDKSENETISIKKIFKEFDIQGVPEYENLVEDSQNNDASKSNNMRSLKKLSKDKLGLKSTINKIKIMKCKNIVPVGTSHWSVSPFDLAVDNDKNRDENYSNEIDIDEMFDSIDNKMQDKITQKLGRIKRELEREYKYEKKKKRTKIENEMDDVEKLGLKGPHICKPLITKPIKETTNLKPANEDPVIEQVKNISELNKRTTLQTSKIEIDPNKFIKIKAKHVNTRLPDELGGEEQGLDDSETEDQYQIISEAFADDDVVDEFRKEKEEEINKSQPKDIDFRLPGWGSWGGKNLKQPQRKKRRFILKVPKENTRRDENKGDVVIIEEKCPKIKKHLVGELPFPFSSVQDFEASIRAPVSREFVPEKTFSKLITPNVKTKIGKIIEPMSEDVLVKTDNLKRRKKPAQKSERIKGKAKPASKVRPKVVRQQQKSVTA
ncbi:U3 small nucleolar RNA-associated protein 14 homolog A [Phymastichus coffea]|uniref:U3 small nucleolar RNA-associated protein 14 homolog A n=1 Tax=Phymastichus coffea TaxID=108790 RepID=UPI00273C1A06|nr:U3 small nucleolar RNA-associated protein 14 homolog A [Phymastichus coffea]